MNYEDVKAKLLWNWTHDEPVASEIYTDDALLEFPQSGEKFRGKENFITWRREHPAQTIEFELRSIRGEGDTWVAEGRVESTVACPSPGWTSCTFAATWSTARRSIRAIHSRRLRRERRTPSALNSMQRRGFLSESRRQVASDLQGVIRWIRSVAVALPRC
jgi:hypothetical protein